MARQPGLPESGASAWRRTDSQTDGTLSSSIGASTARVKARGGGDSCHIGVRKCRLGAGYRRNLPANSNFSVRFMVRNGVMPLLK
jgi:hypothetical protein